MKANYRIIFLNLAVACVYFLAGESTALFANAYEMAGVMQPALGIALAIVLLGGTRYMPGLFLGASVLKIATGYPVILAMGLSGAMLVSSYAGGWLLRKLYFDLTLSRLYDFLILAITGVNIAILESILNTGVLLLGGWSNLQTGLQATLNGWMGSTFAIVLVPSFILVWKQKPDKRLNAKVLSEALLILGLAFLLGQILFLDWWHDMVGGYGKDFMMFLLIAVAAIRLGRHGVLLILLMNTLQATLGAHLGIGYFGDEAIKTHLTSLWLYLLILSLVGMMLASYISEKHIIEKALQDGENRFRNLAENIPVLVWMCNANGDCHYFNNGWLAFTGRTIAQELGDGWMVNIHPADLPECQKYVQDILISPRPFTIEYRLRRHDGQYRDVIDRGMPRYDKSGEFIGFIGSVFDVSDLKKAQAAMHDSEIRFKQLLDKIPLVSVQGYAADGTTNYWNQASEILYGYTAEEALGQKLADLIIPPEMHTLMYDGMRQMFATGDPIPASELTLLRKNGESVNVFSSHAYVHVPGREPELFCIDIDLTERKKDEARIRNLAFYDPLTQLPNRSLLMEKMSELVTESGGYSALLFIDLDNFKTLNDTLGHDKGDGLLKQVAKRLTDNIKATDTVARLGGDEFVVLLTGLSLFKELASFQTEAACKKILALLNQPYWLDDLELHSTSSLGVALFTDHQQSLEELMKRADIALYQAKQSGRNTFRFFDPEMQAAVEKRALLEDGLRYGLAKQQFSLHYQVQIDALGQVQGAEALLRWQHPTLGRVPPNDFICLAEENRMIIPIGLWVLETACVQLHRWQNDPFKQHLQIAVNVSAIQFRQPDFREQVIAILEKTHANPARLKLELTETLIFDNIDDTIAKMTALKKIGVMFSMDDFGTGYSSLASLKKLPFDQLKIDQSFVRDIANNPEDATIVQTIIAMADNLGMAAIAEGVETEQQQAFLIKHGCLHFQGFLFGKPMPIEEFEQLLG